MTGEQRRVVTELMRESARVVVASAGDGFYSWKEIADARRFLRETEAPPKGWAGKLPGLPAEQEKPDWVY